jgi:geranylgeranyl pyrophosphate synthase
MTQGKPSGCCNRSALTDGLKRIQADIHAALDALLPVPDDARARLFEAMRYAAIGGGKRLRPLLLTAVAEMYGVDRMPRCARAWRSRRSMSIR